MPLGAIIGAIGGLLGNSQQNANNMRAQEMNYAQNLEFWKMQNEYNTPKAQMERYKEAGLNPHLIYGQGNSGNAGPIAPAPIPAVKAAPITEAVQVYLDLKAKDQEIENSRLDAILKDKEITNRAQQNLIQDTLFDTAMIDDPLKEQVKKSEGFKTTVLKNQYTQNSLPIQLQELANKQVMQSILANNRDLKAYEVSEAKFNDEMLKKFGILQDDDLLTRALKVALTLTGKGDELKGGIINYLQSFNKQNQK